MHSKTLDLMVFIPKYIQLKISLNGAMIAPGRSYLLQQEQLFRHGSRRLILLMSTLLFLLGTFRLSAQVYDFIPVRTPQNVTVNRILPKKIITPGETMPVTFSKEPTDEEIFRVHFFEEPLVPMKGTAVPAENVSFVYTLAGFSQRKNPDDFSALKKFLIKYPNTRWRGSILANLGIAYRRTGYYNQAMNAWEQAWSLLKNETDPRVKILADRVISELLLINCWVGRQEIVEYLLKEIENREIQGPAVQRILSAKSAFWLMKNRPGISFKCGPYALNKIFSLKDGTRILNDKLMEVQSTNRGFSLTELEKMSKDIGLNYQMAFRQPGAAVIINAVVHWKLDHYSALLKVEGGQYKCEDATMGSVYGQQFWLTPAALDSSASGYFLVPDNPLPNGWRKVMAEEGNNVFGKGQEPPSPKPNSPGDPKFPKNPPCPKPMAQSNVHAASVSLHVFDRPVYYTPPRGPAMEFDVDYIQRDSYQPANFTYSNFGPKWTFKWLSYVQDDPNNGAASADIYLMQGGVRTFASFNTTTNSYAPEIQTNDVLVRVCPTCYELRHPDGSKEVYARPDGNTVKGRKVFLTQLLDPAGNAMTIVYDSLLRIVALRDGIGQVTGVKYGNSSDIYKITKVTDPFGRSASFGYDDAGRLNKITDMIGIVSSFQYEAGDFLKEMKTPYGVTRFIKEEGPGNYRSVETLYPLGEKERVEFTENAPGILSSESIYPTGMVLFNSYLNFRNTFFWDKKAMKEAPGDYTKAVIYHWLHGNATTGEDGNASPLLESEKQPLENRVWYNYQGQSFAGGANQGMSSQPSVIGRVLDDSTTQLRKFTYNALGKRLSAIDPLGRTFLYKYDTTNNIDLLEVRQGTKGADDMLIKYTYNSQHRPLTARYASGQVNKYIYNGNGQLVNNNNAKKENTKFSYNKDGYLDSLSGPVNGSRMGLTYDGFGRVNTITDVDGYKTSIDYDALDRPTLFTYPDNTYKQIVYDRLDAVHFRDQLGRWSHTTFDSLQRPAVMQDALGRTTQFIWCSCGSISEVIDPLKQITSFTRDLQGRMTSKIFGDGKIITYRYENTTSRLKEVTDPKLQKTRYTYYGDNDVRQVDYPNAIIPTPSVAYTYDEDYNRMKTMVDGSGVTSYMYNPVNATIGAGRISSIDGPLLNDLISYKYDSLGRELRHIVNGVASSVVYDALGRVTLANNALGTFKYSYAGESGRLSSINMPSGQNSFYEYFDTQDNLMLKQIWNKTSGGNTLSKFNYQYNNSDKVVKWTEQTGVAAPTYFEPGYDPADQLISAVQKNESTGGILKRYSYGYDKAGNRISEQVDNSVTGAVYNTVNQVTRQLDGGLMLFEGGVSEFSSVNVVNRTSLDSVTTSVDSSTNIFRAFVKVVPGNNNVSITVTDFSGNSNNTLKSYSINVAPGKTSTPGYDNNGNLISDRAGGVSYDWDAADRLVKITTGSNITEFVYDGLNRRVIEKLNGAILKRWLWCGTELCEERDVNGGIVKKRFFMQGEQVNGVNYYYTRDHLGSIRELTDRDGNLKARYTYDPYGRRKKVFGTLDAVFGFTGHYYHAGSKLYLTLFRAYDPEPGRWLSRDPLGMENKEINLYNYVSNDPINLVDPDGRQNVQPKTPSPGPPPSPPGPPTPPGMCKVDEAWLPPSAGSFVKSTACLALCMASSNPYSGAAASVFTELMSRECNCSAGPDLGSWIDIYGPCPPPGPSSCKEPNFTPKGPNHSGP